MKQKITYKWHLEIIPDGEYLTLWADNELVCCNVHYSQVPEVYLQWIKDVMGPGELVDYEMPAPLLNWEHPFWFEGYKDE